MRSVRQSRDNPTIVPHSRDPSPRDLHSALFSISKAPGFPFVSSITSNSVNDSLCLLQWNMQMANAKTLFRPHPREGLRKPLRGDVGEFRANPRSSPAGKMETDSRKNLGTLTKERASGGGRFWWKVDARRVEYATSRSRVREILQASVVGHSSSSSTVKASLPSTIILSLIYFNR